eukprot:TRINITY_DN1178_c0_g1_i4.p1 TRINITY_DN1178_c0_g1~~TRINITY_DN1178_c0_g1_i4.p1  ORF type:complete len:141 (-),score=10.54 TRINITY_DN1178_c0_g1_i4:25-447(-)
MSFLVRFAAVFPRARPLFARVYSAVPVAAAAKGRFNPDHLIHPDDMVTGMEKFEYDANKKGLDPFEMTPLGGRFGTSASPAVITSVNKLRIVGCTGGHADAEHDLLWFNLVDGHPRSCPECGQVFVLDRVEETAVAGHHH